MTDFAQLSVQLELQQAAFQKGMDDAAKRLEKIGSSANKSQGALESMAAGFGRLQGAIAAVAGVLAAFKGLGAIAEAGDKLATLQGSFAALLGDGGRASDMMARVFEIAQKTGAPLDDVSSSVQRLSIGLKGMGGSNEQIAQIAENFIKLGRVGGASVVDTANALRQFGQALASGKLQGDELRSILENMPLLAQKLATELGVSVGKLKEMGADGQITADVMANALLKATAQINDDFAKLPRTFEQGLNGVETAWTRVSAKTDETLGISRTLVTVTDEIEKIITRWGDELSRSTDTSNALRQVFQFIIAVAAETVFVVEQLVKLMIALGVEAYNIISLDWGKVGNATKEWERNFASARTQADAFIKTTLDPLAQAVNRVSGGYGEAAKKVELFKKQTGGGDGGKGGKGAADAAAKEAEALRKRGDAIAASVNPLFAYKQTMKELDELLVKSAISETNYALAKEKANQTLHAAGDAVRAATDPLFVYNQELAKLNALLSSNEISMETFNAAVDKAKEKLATAKGEKKEKTFMEQVEDVAKSAGEAMGQFFGDIISGSATADEAFKKMAQSILSKIAEMVAAAVAAKIVSLLFGGGGGASPASGSGTLFSAATSASQAVGSALQGINAASSQAAGLFAASSFDAPAPRLGATENIAGTTAGVATNRPELNVVVNNNAGALVSTRQGDDGSLEITIDRVRRALSRDLTRGGNIFADSLERSYNIGRAGVVV